MPQLSVTFRNPSGLHARAAAALCIAATRSESTVTVSKNGRAVNEKSVMKLLTLDCRCGDTVVIAADGPDAMSVLEQLHALVESGFGEQG